LQTLDRRVEARRSNFARYVAGLGDLPGIEFMPEARYGVSNRWLTTLTIDPDAFGATREDVRLALEADDIESRPLWKPMHLQLLRRLRVVVGSGRACSIGACACRAGLH
jgi:pyridoxal phosphate-dependent aminotransferase EpsN